VGPDDTAEDIEYLAGKMVNLRIFEDEAGKMNRSLLDIGGQALVVSQFTLWADTRKGRRPSFVQAAPPDKAETMYEQFVARVRELGVDTATGRFAAMMQVHLVNDAR
jgi:D-tyrosyl-tRNA(Tyr) deacylase